MLFFKKCCDTTVEPIADWASCPSAWLYSGNCGADTVYTNNNIPTLNAQWADISNGGALTMQLAQDYNGCAYSLANAADVKANSQEQFLTIVSHCSELADFRSLISTQSLIDNFIADSINFLNTTGWTGIDIDFECFYSWTAQDMTNYADFLAQVVQALHLAGYKVNVALNPKSSATTGPPNLDYTQLAGIPVDMWEIMAYDYMYGLIPGTNAPIQLLSWAGNVYNYAASVFGNNNVTIGIPSYGYHDACGAVTNNPTYFDTGSITPPANAVYDAASGELTWQTGGECYYLSDQTAMETKRTYLEGLGAKHIAVWAIGGNTQWFEGTEPSCPADPVNPPDTTVNRCDVAGGCVNNNLCDYMGTGCAFSEVNGSVAINNCDIEVTYPANTLYNGGVNTPWNLPSRQDTWMSYCVEFDNDFDFVLGGKMPGLAGGSRPTGGVGPQCSGYSARMMWGGGTGQPEMILYLYHQGQAGTYGDEISTGIIPQQGQKYCFTQHINVGTPGNADGTIEIWVNGVQVINMQNIQLLCAGETWQTDWLLFSTFYGGGTSNWESNQTNTATYSDFCVGTTQQSVN